MQVCVFSREQAVLQVEAVFPVSDIEFKGVPPPQELLPNLRV